MIKIRNKAIYTFLLLITFFAFNVSASAKDVQCTIHKSSAEGANNTVDTKTNEKLKTFRYTAKCDDGTQYVALCLDPGKASNKVGSRFKKVENSALAKYMISLEKLYDSNTGCTAGTDSCITKYQTALRIAESKYSIGHSLGASSGRKIGGELDTAYKAFKEGHADDCTGGMCASAIAKAAYDSMGSVSTTKTKGKFSKSGNDIVLTLTGKTKAPKRVVFTINGRTYTIENPTGQLNGDVYTMVVPPEYLASLTDCVEVQGDVVYDHDAGDDNDLSKHPTFEPIYGTREEVQDYGGFKVVKSSETYISGYRPVDGEEVVTITSHVGPSRERRTGESGNPVICEGEGEYDDDDDQPKPCKTNFNLTCAPADDEDGFETYTYNEGTPNGKGDTDWESCIINNTDIKGNPYDINVDKLDSDAWVYYDGEGWDLVTDANYCTISCKEKYEYKMPANKKDVKFGTYFSFDIASPLSSKGDPYHAVAGVSNEKQCVTSGAKDPDDGIDIDIYESRILSLRKQLIDYMNVYNYYSAMYDKLMSLKDSFVDNSISDSLIIGDSIDPSSATERSAGYDSGSIKSDSNWDSDLFNNWLEENGWDTSLLYDGKQDIFEKVTFNYSFSYTQYSLANPNDVSSGITSVSRTGYTNNAFPTTYTTYLKNMGTDFYCNQFNLLCNLNTVRGYIDSIDYEYITGSIDYKYHDDSVDEILAGDDLVDYYNVSSSVDAWMKYQKPSQREDAFNLMMNAIERIVNDAYGRINSLPYQIERQNEGLKKCLETVSGIPDYRLEPTITWDYDQKDYIEKMNSKDLVLIDDDNNRLIDSESERKKTNYCSRDSKVSSAGEVFTICPDSASDITFNYIGSDGSTKTMTYKPVSRVGVTITNKCNSSDGYCYYSSSTPFATYPPDGKVSRVEDNVTNATIIEEDGLVFPVTITTESGQHYYSLKFGHIGENIQTGEINSRLMGESDSVLSGDYKDNAVCTYEVIRPVPGQCDDIVEEYCLRKDGKVTKGGYVDDIKECVQQLINKKDDNGYSMCCDIAKSISENVSEYGLWSTDANDIYTAACDGVGACTGFKIVDGSSGLEAYDQALISSNGDLQFTVRTVSLNKLFPNGDDKRGVNWSSSYLSTTKNGLVGSRGLRIDSVIDYIESAGESIYGEKPDYKITLTASCARRLREENSKGDLDDGFLSYNLSVETTDEYHSDYLPGSRADNYEFFEKIKNEYGCGVEYGPNKEPSNPEIGIQKK